MFSGEFQRAAVRYNMISDKDPRLNPDFPRMDVSAIRKQTVGMRGRELGDEEVWSLGMHNHSRGREGIMMCRPWA